MKITTWNVNGLRAILGKGFLEAVAALRGKLRRVALVLGWAAATIVGAANAAYIVLQCRA